MTNVKGFYKIHLQKKRQRGNNSEWFNFTEEDLEFIKKFLEQYRNEESDKKEAEIVAF